MKVALGMVVKNFVSEQPLASFLDNAQRYGRSIDRLIVVYSHQLDQAVLRRLEARVPVSLIRLNHYTEAESTFRRLGMPPDLSSQLLYCPLLADHGLVPYGFNRNTALIEALLRHEDVLLFVDSDVEPCVLSAGPDGAVQKQAVDFTGSHLAAIASGADLTTSDYSGYHILPPAAFDGMEDLLTGLEKEALFPFWGSSPGHHSLTLQTPENSRIRPTNKLLGGNLAIRTAVFQHLPPFFSSAFFFEGTPFLCRGEDTLLGLAAGEEARCLDIGLPIFHNAYGNFPTAPDLARDPGVKNRLFYACCGWLGRNVFLHWIRDGRAETDPQRCRCLEKGAVSLARYTGDARFLSLPAIGEAAQRQLPNMIEQYQKTEKAWRFFTERWSFS